MRRAEIIFPALIFAIVAVLLALGYWHYEYAWISFAFPLAVGIVLCGMCAVEIIAVRRRLPAAVSAGSDVEAADGAADTLSLPAVAWMFGLAVFLYGLGFIAGPALYLLICLRANGASLAMATGVGTASIAVTWGLFIHVMGILLPVMPLWMPS